MEALITDAVAKGATIATGGKRIGNVGHAYQDDTHRFVHRIAPKVVVPIHTLSPYRLHPVGDTSRLVVEFAQSYDFKGRTVAD